MEEFRTNIFEKTKAKSRKRLLYNLAIIVILVAIWLFHFVGVPVSTDHVIILEPITAIGLTIAVLGMKLYDDKYTGISAYGDRSAKLVIAEQYLEIRDVKIPYTELTNLVIYVDEYLGMPREIFGIHHGGNNKIEFEHKGSMVTINYIIKNKEDFNRVSLLVNGIEKNPGLQKNLRKL